jgi:hypothetical protein
MGDTVLLDGPTDRHVSYLLDQAHVEGETDIADHRAQEVENDTDHRTLP